MQVALILCVAVRDSLHFAANYLEFYVLSCSYHTFINRIARNCIDLWTKLLLKLFLPYSTTFFKIVSVSFVVCVFCYTFFSFGICHCLNVHDRTRCFAYSDYAFFNNFDYWCGNFLAASDACVLVTGFAFFFCALIFIFFFDSWLSCANFLFYHINNDDYAVYSVFLPFSLWFTAIWQLTHHQFDLFIYQCRKVP